MKSWEVSGSFWKKVDPLIPPSKRDSKKINLVEREKQCLQGNGRDRLFIVRGLQGKAFPKGCFGSSSNIHAHFIIWTQSGFLLFFRELDWMKMINIGDISWKWQSIDGAIVKGPLGQETVGPNPTDRGKKEASEIC